MPDYDRSQPVEKRVWATAARIAWRESRASSAKFLFVVLAVAAGVGALSGVRGFSAAFSDMLLRDARTLMAADLTVRTFHLPEGDQQQALDSLVADGARRTWITETVSMLSSESSSNPLLTTVKAVDPAQYPFYGEVKLRPDVVLRDVLDERAVVVSDDLILRLGVEVGDEIRVGSEQFEIAAVIAVEPDRMTGSFNIGPRLIISREGLDRAGLMQRGSRAGQRFLFRLPDEGLSVADASERMEASFEPWRVVDFRETHPTIRRGLSRATNFLSLVSLIAMIVGALGVAMAMQSHIEQRLDSIAIMKCLGGRSSQVMRIFLLQGVGLGLAGSLLGVGLGYLAQVVAPGLITRYFPVAPQLDWQPEAALQALVIGLLTTLLFTVPPLLRVRSVRPALIFRREMERGQKSWRERLTQSGPAGVAAVAILLGLGATAAWLGDSLAMGLWFAGGLTASVVVLTAAAWALLRFLKKLPGWLPMRLPLELRHGLANLHRPGVHAEAILVALGVGVTFTLSVYLIQSSVLTQIIRSAPPDMPNVFLMNVTNNERDGLLELLHGFEGMEGEPTLVPSVAARLLSVDGTTLDELDLGREAGRFRGTRTISWRDELPDEIELLQGEWWQPGEQGNLVSARENAAEVLGIEIGDEIEWQVGADRVRARVAAIHRTEAIRQISTASFILTPTALANRPAVYFGGLRVAPERAVELQRVAFEAFPTVSVINAADVLRIVQEVVDQIALVIRFVSGFAILGGVIILASSVMSTRFRRIRETAVLKTLGATRRRVAGIFSVEFVVLGAAAGLIGSFLASGFSALLLERMLDAEAYFDWVPNAATVLATAVVASFAGWLASFRILGRKPLEVLRGE